MALSAHSRQVLAVALASADAANEVRSMLEASVASPAAKVTALGSSVTVAALGVQTVLTAVPGTFANLAAVQSYLADAGVMTLVQSRLAAVEADADAIAAALTTAAAKLDAVIAALKTAGLMTS